MICGLPQLSFSTDGKVNEHAETFEQLVNCYRSRLVGTHRPEYMHSLIHQVLAACTYILMGDCALLRWLLAAYEYQEPGKIRLLLLFKAAWQD